MITEVIKDNWDVKSNAAKASFPQIQKLLSVKVFSPLSELQGSFKVSETFPVMNVKRAASPICRHFRVLSKPRF